MSPLSRCGDASPAPADAPAAVIVVAIGALQTDSIVFDASRTV